MNHKQVGTLQRGTMCINRLPRTMRSQCNSESKKYHTYVNRRGEWKLCDCAADIALTFKLDRGFGYMSYRHEPKRNTTRVLW